MKKEYRSLITRLICQQEVFTKQIFDVMHEDNDFYFCKDYFVEDSKKPIVLSKKELYVPIICKSTTILFGFDEELLYFIYVKYLITVERRSGNEQEALMLQSKIIESKKRYRFILEDFD